ncbi:MAG: acetylxylan esterase [Clostridia bacterium]|nr:acetylxylan esterase [Clostridia bacterium]
MPTIDMPLEKLHQYQGRNPRPADFDEFWETALAEMRATDPKVELVPVDLPSKIVDFYDLYFTGTKGARIHAKLAKPKNIKGKAPAILKFHGLSGNAGSFRDLICYAAEGFIVASMDCRGQGGFSEDMGQPNGTTHTTQFVRGLDGDPQDLHYRDVFLDTAMLARIIMDMDDVDETRVAAKGGSQGGALTIACAALEPRIALALPTYPYLSDYKRVWEMDLAKGAYEGLRYYFRHFDPRHEREEEIFTNLGYIDIQFLAPRIKAKVIMSTGLMDTTCPPSTQFAAFNKMNTEKVSIIYPDFGHESLEGQSDLEMRYLSELL